jgi:hypothetical protein
LVCAGNAFPTQKFQLNFCPGIFKKILQNLNIFDELIIYFVSYVLGLAKRGSENSENAIADNLKTQNFQNSMPTMAAQVMQPCILKSSAFISAQLPFTTENFPAQK